MKSTMKGRGRKISLVFMHSWSYISVILKGQCHKNFVLIETVGV